MAHYEEYSRKVFIGGIPDGTSVFDLRALFKPFSPLRIYHPCIPGPAMRPYTRLNGYAFLLFNNHESVLKLKRACHNHRHILFYPFNIPHTNRNLPASKCSLTPSGYCVQVRFWRNSDYVFRSDSSLRVDPRKTVFIGAVPRTLTAESLTHLLREKYPDVFYVELNVDMEFHYPKGAARATFASHKSFEQAISDKFLEDTLLRGDSKVMEMYPYILNDCDCDNCAENDAKYYCTDFSCLQYFCERCYLKFHEDEKTPLKHQVAARILTTKRATNSTSDFYTNLSSIE